VSDVLCANQAKGNGMRSVEEQVDARLSVLCMYDISHRWLETETATQIAPTL
jgi:hypothetical protein